VHVCTNHVAGEDKETLGSTILSYRGGDEGEVVSVHTLKAWGGGGADIYLYSLLTSVLGRDEQSTSQPGCFISGERGTSVAP